MDEPTALLPPVSTQSLAELLERGPLPVAQGLELMGVIAGQVAKLHSNARTHGLLTAQVIRVQLFESGPPVVVFNEPEATRDMSEGSDQFALGVLCFQVLIGRLPKANETLSQAMPEAPTALDRLVQRLMAANPADRMNAAGAQRQFSDLAGQVGETSVRPASPLGAPPVIKRGIPIGIQKTDAHAWVNKDAGGSAPRPPIPKSTVQTDNPFGDDEATVAVPRATAPDPPPKLAGPALEDEPTQFVDRPQISRPLKRKGVITDRADTPPPPPIATPMEVREAATMRAPAITERQPIEPTVTPGFEPSRSDLPGNTDEGMTDPRLTAIPRKKKPVPSTGAQLLATLGRQPPWVWGAAGVGLAFFVLLLIALAR